MPYGVYGTSWTDAQGNLWYKIYGDNYRHDTLWTIAEKFYGDGSKYPIIYNLNRDKINDPHWIYPNHIIKLREGVPPVVSPPPPPPPPKPATWTGGEFMEDKPVVNISREEYVMGVYDMEISSSEYEKNSCVILKPTFDNANIREISITADETHPALDASYFAGNTTGRTASDVVTSIEYYVSIGDTWMPIFPSNFDRVRNEKLFVNSNRKATLRFKADTSYDTSKTAIYADGVKLPNSRTEWSFDSDKQTVIIYNYNSSKSYTMDYVPLFDAANDPKKVSISEATLQTKLKTMTEVFPDGTDANMKIRLSHTPYIDTAKVYASGFDPNNTTSGVAGSNSYPVNVSVSRANFVDKDRRVVTDFTQKASDGKSIHLKNITNYADKSIPDFNPFDATSNPNVEFYQSGKDLYFSEPFKYGSDIDNIRNGVHGEGTITVTYQYPEVTLKIKAIMRRTTDVYDKHVTPMINSIRVDAKSIK